MKMRRLTAAVHVAYENDEGFIVDQHYALHGNAFNPDTGKIANYRELKDCSEGPEWEKSCVDEFGRLAQGHQNMNGGTNTMHFIRRNQIPKGKQATYLRIVCAYRPEKDNPHRVRFTAGGDRIDYPGDVSTKTCDLKDFYLGSPMPEYEYMRIPVWAIPKAIMDFYNLWDLVEDGYVYVEIRKGMYGLPQAGSSRTRKLPVLRLLVVVLMIFLLGASIFYVIFESRKWKGTTATTSSNDTAGTTSSDDDVDDDLGDSKNIFDKQRQGPAAGTNSNTRGSLFRPPRSRDDMPSVGPTTSGPTTTFGSHEPTPSPTTAPTMDECVANKIKCDFSNIDLAVVAVAVDDNQATALRETCGLTVSTTNAATTRSLMNIFDSSNTIRQNELNNLSIDPADLGSTKKGDELFVRPNDNAYDDGGGGGCFVFVFDDPVVLYDVGLVDTVYEVYDGNDRANLTYTNVYGSSTTIFAPEDDGGSIIQEGSNSHDWIVSETSSLCNAVDVRQLEVCIPPGSSSGGRISFIEISNCGGGAGGDGGGGDEDEDEDDDEDDNDYDDEDDGKNLVGVDNSFNAENPQGEVHIAAGRRSDSIREELRQCIHWAVGLEHESMLVHRHEDGLEEYAIDANKILREMARYGSIYGLDELEHRIAVRAHDDGAEFSGRRCAKSIDFSYKTMMESVSTDALELSFDGAYDQLRKIDETFLKMANLHPFIKKVINETGLGAITRPSTGMSNQLGMYQRSGGNWYTCASGACGSCSLKDYTGSYHMSLSLPTTPEGWVARDKSILTGPDTCAPIINGKSKVGGAASPFSTWFAPTEKQVKQQQWEEWIDANMNLGNMVQWIEPLLVAVHGSADMDAVCDNGLYTEGSFRSMRTGWGVPGTTDVRTFREYGTTRYVQENFDWMFPDETEIDKMPSAYRENLSSCMEDGMGADIRTKSSIDEHDLAPGESIPPMEVGRGIEIRIFDNFPIEHMPQVYRMIAFVAEAGRNYTAPDYMYNNTDWSGAMQAVMREGWNAKLPEGYVKAVAIALNMPPRFMEKIGQNFQAFNIFTELYKALWDSHSRGMWSVLLLDRLPTELPELANPNRESWEIGATKMGFSPDQIIETFGVDRSSLPQKIKVGNIELTNDSCGEDLEDLVYLAERYGMVSFIRVNKHGEVESFFFKSEDEWDTSAYTAPVCIPKPELEPEPADDQEEL